MLIQLAAHQTVTYVSWLEQWEKIHGRNSTAVQRTEAFYALVHNRKPSWIG